MKHRFPNEVILPSCNSKDIEKLEKMYDKNTMDILQIKKSDDYIEPIKDCKKIFFNVDTDEALDFCEEFENIQTEDDLRSLVKICRGLVKAAVRLEILYKNAANFKKCILWGLVSCFTGHHSDCVLQDIGVAISMRDGKL